MTRITAEGLRTLCGGCCFPLKLDLDDLWVQRSATGWHCYRKEGAGARPLAECLTAKEMWAFLNGLQAGAVIRASADLSQ